MQNKLSKKVIFTLLGMLTVVTGVTAKRDVIGAQIDGHYNVAAACPSSSGTNVATWWTHVLSVFHIGPNQRRGAEPLNLPFGGQAELIVGFQRVNTPLAQQVGPYLLSTEADYFSAVPNALVLAAASGTVTAIGSTGSGTGYGNSVTVTTMGSPGYDVTYTSMQLPVSPLLHIGEKIDVGQRLGIQGHSGAAVGDRIGEIVRRLQPNGQVDMTTTYVGALGPTSTFGLDDPLPLTNLNGCLLDTNGVPIPQPSAPTVRPVTLVKHPATRSFVGTPTTFSELSK